MSIFGEIADSILIAGACATADVECFFSSMGIKRRKGREVGNNTNKGNNVPVTDNNRVPVNPPQVTTPVVETVTPPTPNNASNSNTAQAPVPVAEPVTIPPSGNDTNDHCHADPTPKPDETCDKNNHKPVETNGKNNRKPDPVVTGPSNETASNPIATEANTQNASNTNPVMHVGSNANHNNAATNVHADIDAAMSNRPFMTTTDNGRIDVDLGAIASSGANTNAFRSEFNPNPMGPALQFIPMNQPIFTGIPGMPVGAPIFYGPAMNVPPVAPVQNVVRGIPLKADEPKKAKAVRLPRNPEETNIDQSTEQTVKGMVQVQPGKENVTIENSGFVPTVPTPDTTSEKPVSKIKSNKPIIDSYPFMREIEEIALENGYQIEFRFHDNIGAISAAVYDANSMTLIDGKGFVIDLGNIIDRRKKVFLGFHTIFERLPAYHAFGKPDKNGVSKLNKEFFKTIIVGGNAAAANVKPMYSPEFTDLNAHVALITMTKLNLHPDDRRYLQGRLVDVLNAGIFGEVRHVDPLTRFRIAEFDKKTKTIILDSDGVTVNYGYEYIPHARHQIIITENDVTIKHGDFVDVKD